MDTMTNELGIEVKLGTVSHGTMRPQDLIPRFLEALREVDPGQHEAFVSTPFTAVPAWVQDEGDDCEWWSGEDAGHLLNELFEALDNAAPRGVYFSAHEGDGSDYGFWLEDPCFYEEDGDPENGPDDELPCDLAYIARHVTKWPEGAGTVRLDSDGEICFDGETAEAGTAEHDFYPEARHNPAVGDMHPEFLPDRENGMTWVGKDYTRDEWAAATYGEAFEEDHGE